MASMDTQCDYTKGSNGKEWKNAANVLLGDMLLMTVIKTVPHIKKQIQCELIQCDKKNCKF